MTLSLADLRSCFYGVVPSLISTCSKEGEPNVTYLSQVYLVDDRHVALSCQFFNKTRRNVEENPYATVNVMDPVTLQAYRLELRLDHVETSGPLFDSMALRIQVIASQTGMDGVFKLISADVYEVLSLERVEGFLTPERDDLPELEEPKRGEPFGELCGLQRMAARIGHARDLEQLLEETLRALDEILGFKHSMVLLFDDDTNSLITIASRGYGEHGIGAEVPLGAGIIGTVAAQKRFIRVAGVGSELRYGRAIRRQALASGQVARLSPEIPLPGLPDAQAQLVLPMLLGDRLIGVLALEGTTPLAFDHWDEAFLQIIGYQIALAIDRMQAIDEEQAVDLAEANQKRLGANRSFVYYQADESIFVDDEYLVRNIPAKILRSLIQARLRDGRSDFSNRELRLDSSLGLPELRDNLESRLILLRRRLEEKCPELRLETIARGRFRLVVECAISWSERP